MSARRCAKIIKGTVCCDIGRNGKKENMDPSMKGIVINLFKPADRGIQNDGGANVRIRRDRLIGRTETDDTGKFRFYANNCDYSISLDVSTLPKGTAALSPYRSVPAGSSDDIRFDLKEISLKKAEKSRNANDNEEYELCSADRIRLAYDSGLIDETTKVRYLTRALFHTGRLPDEYRSRVPIKSGTGLLEELGEYLKSRSTEPIAAEYIRQSLASSVPELDRSFISPGGHFNIHYTLNGENAVDYNYRDPEAVPSYIRQIAEAFENVRTVTCISRGYRSPLLEEGKGSYDIHVFDLKDKYGVTYSSQIYGAKGIRSGMASSYICVDNSYSSEKGFDKSRLDCMRVTAAHEYFHAVQYAYNVKADTWWKEASATWNEDEVYTGINDYVRYIRKYLRTPGLSLDKASYGGVIYAKFLSQYYGGREAIRKIWELQASGYDNSIQAIDRYIRTYYAGKDIGAAYNQFSTYNTNPAQYYKEGAAWNLSAAAQNTYAKYPITASFGQLDHLAANYQLFKPIDFQSAGIQPDRSLKISVEGGEGRWGFTLQKRNSRTKQYSVTEILSRGLFDRAEIELGGFGSAFDEVWLIPANLETEHDRMPYTYSADTIAPPETAVQP